MALASTHDRPRPWTRRAIAAPVIAALLATGCAGDLAGPGAELSTGANPPATSAKSLLSDAERSATCATLEGSITAQVPRIKALEAAVKSEQEGAAPTLARTFARMFGPPGSDNKALSELQRERALSAAYNDALRAKGCATVDVEALVKAPAVAVANGPGVPTTTPPPQAGVAAPDVSDLPDLSQVTLPRRF